MLDQIEQRQEGEVKLLKNSSEFPSDLIGIEEIEYKNQTSDSNNTTTSLLLSDSHGTITCYICAKKYSQLHKFYDRLCPECAQFNWEKRIQRANLSGKIALVTGARVKIGYEMALILLRCGATVLTTTRFPRDAALRFSKEKDFLEWSHRLQIFGVDFRDVQSVIDFTDIILKKYDQLDYLINNAAQTIRRPPVFYEHLLPIELSSIPSLSDNGPGVDDIKKLLGDGQERLQIGNDFQSLKSFVSEIASYSPVGEDKVLTLYSKKMDELLQTAGLDMKIVSRSAILSQVPLIQEDFQFDYHDFPKDAYDNYGQQIDLRKKTSWNLGLTDVSITEFVETQTINLTAPFILIQKLLPLMQKSSKDDGNSVGNKQIINVSATEGQFYRFAKGTNHPHTNIAKAGLNMLTRTSGYELAKLKIFMNSVDTSWVTQEDASDLTNVKSYFTAPLDEIDGAQRCLDPIFQSVIKGVDLHSKFLKNYKVTRW